MSIYMYMYMYMCILCTYINTCTYIHRALALDQYHGLVVIGGDGTADQCVCVYIYIYIYICMYVCMYVCVCILCTYISTCTYIHRALALDQYHGLVVIGGDGTANECIMGLFQNEAGMEAAVSERMFMYVNMRTCM